MKPALRKVPVTLTILLMCTLITLPGVFSDDYYELFSGEASDKHGWNYFTCAFLHGKIGVPVVIILHYLLNMGLLLTLGKWVEVLLGTRRFLILSLTAWAVFILIQWWSGLWVNGSSGIIWAFSPFLLIIKDLPPGSVVGNAREMARPFMWIMWVFVTIFMTFVPLIFNPDHSLLHTFVYGNLYHFMATITGFGFYFAWRKK